MSIHYISAQRLLRESWSGQLPDLYDYPARHRGLTLDASVVLIVTSRVKTWSKNTTRRPHGAVASLLVNSGRTPTSMVRHKHTIFRSSRSTVPAVGRRKRRYRRECCRRRRAALDRRLPTADEVESDIILPRLPLPFTCRVQDYRDLHYPNQSSPSAPLRKIPSGIAASY